MNGTIKISNRFGMIFMQILVFTPFFVFTRMPIVHGLITYTRILHVV